MSTTTVTCEHDKAVFGCAGCIAKASIGSHEAAPDKARLYRVDAYINKTATYYVLAASREAARVDAEEMVLDPLDYEIDDEDAIVSEVQPSHRVPSGATVWTGGPDGDWRTASGLGLDNLIAET